MVFFAHLLLPLPPQVTLTVSAEQTAKDNHITPFRPPFWHTSLVLILHFLLSYSNCAKTTGLTIYRNPNTFITAVK